MLDADVVAVSPSSVYRVLKAAGKLAPRWGQPSKKGKGFQQPTRPHELWHVDDPTSTSVGPSSSSAPSSTADSRFIVHWEIHEAVKEDEVETVIQRARELSLGERPGTV